MSQDMKSIRKAYRPELVVLVVEDYKLFAREIKHALPQHRVTKLSPRPAGREELSSLFEAALDGW